MNDVEKFISHLDAKQQEIALGLMKSVRDGKFEDFDVKKLKGFAHMYRLRKGRLRIVFEKEQTGEFRIVLITNRSDTTYNF